jgi:hypothetical protein
MQEPDLSGGRALLVAQLAALPACLRRNHDPTAHPHRVSHKQWAARSLTRLSTSSTNPLTTALHRRDKADTATESFLPCRARPRHSRTQQHSKCGRILPSERLRTRPSRDPKGKRSRRNKVRRASNRISSYQPRGRMRQRRHSSRVPATTTGMEVRAVSASCLATPNRRRATSRNFRRWGIPRGRLGRTDEQG